MIFEEIPSQNSMNDDITIRIFTWSMSLNTSIEEIQKHIYSERVIPKRTFGTVKVREKGTGCIKEMKYLE